MCDRANVFLGDVDLAALRLPDCEGHRAFRIEHPQQASADPWLLQLDFYRLYRKRAGVFLRLDDGFCCYGGEWEDTYRLLALLVIGNDATFGALLSYFQGKRHALMEYLIEPEDFTGLRPPHSLVGVMTRDEAERTLELIPPRAERLRSQDEERRRLVDDTLQGAVGRLVRVELGGEPIHAILEEYCVFRLKAITDSTRNRSPVPVESDR